MPRYGQRNKKFSLAIYLHPAYIGKCLNFDTHKYLRKVANVNGINKEIVANIRVRESEVRKHQKTEDPSEPTDWQQPYEQSLIDFGQTGCFQENNV